MSFKTIDLTRDEHCRARPYNEILDDFIKACDEGRLDVSLTIRLGTRSKGDDDTYYHLYRCGKTPEGKPAYRLSLNTSRIGADLSIVLTDMTYEFTPRDPNWSITCDQLRIYNHGRACATIHGYDGPEFELQYREEDVFSVTE